MTDTHNIELKAAVKTVTPKSLGEQIEVSCQQKGWWTIPI